MRLFWNPSNYPSTHSPTFGSSMPSRTYLNWGYRYGFNSQEIEPIIDDGITSAEFWVYDSKIGRRWNLDPKPNLATSLFACFADNPVWLGDQKGDTLRYASETEDRDFYWRINGDLMKLYASKTAKGLIRYLGGSKVAIEISTSERWYLTDDADVTNSKTQGGDAGGISSTKSNTVYVEYYGNNKTKVDGITAYSHMALIHELQHAKDIESGYASTIYSKFSKGEIKRPDGYNISDIMEMRALYVANKVAKELGLPASEIRTHYEGRRLLKDDGVTPAVSFGENFNPLEGL